MERVDTQRGKDYNDDASGNVLVLWIDDTRDVSIIILNIVNAERGHGDNWNRVNEIQAGQSLIKLKMWESAVDANQSLI